MPAAWGSSRRRLREGKRRHPARPRGARRGLPGRARASPRESWAATSTGVRVGFAGFLVPLGVLFAVRWVVLKGFSSRAKRASGPREPPRLPVRPAPDRERADARRPLRSENFVPVGLSADHSAHALPIAARFGDVRAWVESPSSRRYSFSPGARKSRPIVPFGVLFFLGALFPASNVRSSSDIWPSA